MGTGAAAAAAACNARPVIGPSTLCGVWGHREGRRGGREGANIGRWAPRAGTCPPTFSTCCSGCGTKTRRAHGARRRAPRRSYAATSTCCAGCGPRTRRAPGTRRRACGSRRARGRRARASSPNGSASRCFAHGAAGTLPAAWRGRLASTNHWSGCCAAKWSCARRSSLPKPSRARVKGCRALNGVGMKKGSSWVFQLGRGWRQGWTWARLRAEGWAAGV
jgi:hypothetical protein